MSINFIGSQIMGFIALILVCIAYFVKTKAIFLSLQIVANIFYAAAFLFLQSYVAGLITLISILRCLYIFVCEKKKFKYSAYFLPIFIVCYVAIGVIFWKNWFDIIPIITASSFTIAFFIKGLQKTRILCVLPNALLVIYNIFCRTYSNALLDLLELIVLIVAIISYNKIKKSLPKESDLI